GILPLPYDPQDIAQRPYPPTSPKIYLGKVLDDGGPIYDDPYVVLFTLPLQNKYFYSAQTIKVYVKNGTFDGSYTIFPSDLVPSSDLGCDISNSQTSRLQPWLPDMKSNVIESNKVRAEFQYNQSLYGCSCLLYNQFGVNVTYQNAKTNIVSLVLYKRIINMPDILGYTPLTGLFGDNVTNQNAKYAITTITYYKIEKNFL